MHIDPLNPSGPNDMLFAGHTRVHPKNHILVVGPHCCLLANTIEPSVHGRQGWAVKKTAKLTEMSIIYKSDYYYYYYYY